MNVYYYILGIILVVFSILSLALGIITLRKRLSNIQTFFGLLLLSTFFWSLGSGMELLSLTPWVKIMCLQFSYLGAATAGPLWFLFILSFLGYDHYLKWKYCLLLIPLFIIIMVFTNSWHHLLWPTVTRVSDVPGSLLIYEYGPIYWLNIIYALSMIILGLTFLIQRILTTFNKERLNLFILIFSGLIPIFFNLVNNARLIPIPGFDITPIGLLSALLLIFIAVFRLNLLDIQDIAHQVLFKNITTGIMVFNSDDVLLEINPATYKLGITTDNIGQSVETVLSDYPQIESFYKNEEFADELYLENLGIWIQLEVIDLHDFEESYVGRLLRFDDITKRHETEEALKLSEHKSRTILQAIPDMMFIINQRGEITDFNVHKNTELALPIDDIIGSNLSQLGLSPSDLDRAMTNIRSALDTGSVEHFEYEINLPSGIGYYEARLIKLNPEEVLAIIRDMSEIKEIEKSLIESESLYRTLFENTGVPSAIFNKEGYFTLLNQKMVKFLGYSREELKSKKWREFVYPEDLPMMLEYHQRRQKDPKSAPKSYEARFVNAEGNIHITQITVDKIPLMDEYVVSVVDITPLMEIQNELAESERKYREIFENVQDVFYQANSQGHIIDISPSIKRYSGYEREELLGRKLDELYVNPEDREEMLKIIQKEKEVVDYEVQLKNKDGEVLYVSVNAHHLLDSENNIIGIEGSLRDVSERRRKEEQLAFHLELEEMIMDISKNFINRPLDQFDMAIDEALERIGKFMHVDRSYLFLITSDDELVSNTHEWTADGIKGHVDDLQNLRISDYPWMVKCFKESGVVHIPQVEDLKYEALNERKLCEFQKVKSMVAVALKINEEIIGFIGFDMVHETREWDEETINILKLLGEIFTNLLEKRDKEMAVKKSLEEKEILLKEIHHRVKNNMQIISSLLNLQLNLEEEEKTKNILMESQGRIKSMAMVHEKLYQSTDLSHINFREYLENLVNDLFYSYAVPVGMIDPMVNAENIYINIDTAIPLGLIVNELVSNSLKYAFPDKKGTVKVEFHKIGQNYILKVADDGVGLPPELDIETTKTLGLKLVYSLSEQLDADLKLETSHGTCFQIRFKELSYEERI
ncbi:MAG: PAS domain S-box protein [Methanobacteriaceae archaeon]|nr:PAS domain S-box protein [Methanobacteriaceae archaeon]